MDFKELCAELKETKSHVRYWKYLLQQHGVIDPKKGAGNKEFFSEADVAQFWKVKEYLSNGVATASQAVRLIADKVTPEEAYDQYKSAQRQIEVLQKKVLQLRKPLWKRLVDWIRNLLSGVLPPRTEQ